MLIQAPRDDICFHDLQDLYGSVSKPDALPNATLTIYPGLGLAP